MRTQRKSTAFTLGLLGLLAATFGLLQTGAGETRQLGDPPPIVEEILENVADATDEVPAVPDDMHW